MGCNRNWHIINVNFSLMLLLFSTVHGSTSNDPDSLDALFYDRAREALAKQRTGTILKVPLPANLSGMQVSVVRLRSGSFWGRGANVSSIYIPPRVIPFPFVKRLVIVYHNLGNWSSYYHKVAGYHLVAPVIGFRAYDASKVSNKTLRFSVMGDPILVGFPHIKAQEDNGTLKCVKFGEDGLVLFKNVTNENICITKGDGHFSIAVLSQEKKEKKTWVRWVIGFVAGFIGLVLLGVIVYTTFKLLRNERIRDMEGKSDKGVALGTTWTGRSKMPSASMIRTQPALEQGYAP